jgi:3-oxoacyl-[acyl-carrier-protein] synthase-3
MPRRAAILGLGGYLPDHVVPNDALVRDYGIDTSDAWIRRRTGVEARRFAPPGVGCADLAEPAAREALRDAATAPEELDLIVFCTLSPDRAFPGPGVTLQARLGLGGGGRCTPALDVRNQCSGFLYGLQVARAHVEAGLAERVLVVGAEVHSAALDLTTRGRAVACLFGDGAGAVVVGASEVGLDTLKLGADGEHDEALSQAVWDMRARPFVPVGEDGHARIPPELLYARMDGPLVFRHAVTRLTDIVGTLLADAGLGPEDVAAYAFHQANRRINEAVAAALDLPQARLLTNITRYGNTTAATLPLLLWEADRAGALGPGDRVVLAAFGSGFTWGAGLLTWTRPRGGGAGPAGGPAAPAPPAR